MFVFVLFFVSAVIINMVIVANADKKLGKYGRSELWGRSENSVSAMGTPAIVRFKEKSYKNLKLNIIT